MLPEEYFSKGFFVGNVVDFWFGGIIAVRHRICGGCRTGSRAFSRHTWWPCHHCWRFNDQHQSKWVLAEAGSQSISYHGCFEPWMMLCEIELVLCLCLYIFCGFVFILMLFCSSHVNYDIAELMLMTIISGSMMGTVFCRFAASARV